MHQQNTYQQFPNFTHPPPTITEQSLPSIDDATIEKFLIDRNHQTIKIINEQQKVFNHCTVNGRDRLNVIQMNLNNLIEQQHSEETNLKNNVAHLSPHQWMDKINLLKQNQIKIADLLTKFEKLSSKVTKSTSLQPHKRKKKRRKNNRKLSKIQHSTGQAEEASKRPKFESNLEQSYETYELDRLRTANLKRTSECKKQLSLLDTLIELRCIRRKNSNVSGSNEMSSEKHFIQQIDQLKIKWQDALEKCNSQENELKMLLTNTSSQLWSNALFSNTESPFVDTAMDFKTLLDIRKSWDLCLVTDDDNAFGSSIPPGWVLPNPTPSDAWALFLSK